MARIFISYRRSDSQGWAMALHGRLVQAYGESAAFLDVGRIAPGARFEPHIQAELTAADDVLVVIGPTWATVTDEDGVRRLDHPGDLVRTEIRHALDTGKNVIPILVGGARIPTDQDLPADIAGLRELNAVRIPDDVPKSAIDTLVATLRSRHLLQHAADSVNARLRERPVLVVTLFAVVLFLQNIGRAVLSGPAKVWNLMLSRLFGISSSSSGAPASGSMGATAPAVGGVGNVTAACVGGAVVLAGSASVLASVAVAVAAVIAQLDDDAPLIALSGSWELSEGTVTSNGVYEPRDYTGTVVVFEESRGNRFTVVDGPEFLVGQRIKLGDADEQNGILASSVYEYPDLGDCVRHDSGALIASDVYEGRAEWTFEQISAGRDTREFDRFRLRVTSTYFKLSSASAPATCPDETSSEFTAIARRVDAP